MRAAIQQTCLDERHQVCQGVAAQKQRTRQPRIEPLQHRLDRSEAVCEIFVDSRRDGVVVRRRLDTLR